MKKRVIFQSGMYEQQEKKYMLRRLRYAAVALKTQMPDQKRWTGVLKKNVTKKKKLLSFESEYHILL